MAENVPAELQYTAEHEWIADQAGGIIRFGITHHAQDALGDIVFVSLPAIGARIEAGQPCGEVESTKSVSDIYAPVSGEVVGRNESVETAPETLNSDPYGAGWLVEVKVDGQAGGLLSADEYASQIDAN
mgnify:CR=1 FL=1